MTRRRKPFTMNPDAVAQAARLIDRTEDTGKEYSLTFCGGGYRMRSSGDRDGVTPDACPTNSSERGTFHTHPKGDARPSGADVLVALQQQHKFQCIGILKDGEPAIQCLEFKRDAPSWKTTEAELRYTAELADRSQKTKSKHQRSALADLDSALLRAIERRAILAKVAYIRRARRRA